MLKRKPGYVKYLYITERLRHISTIRRLKKQLREADKTKCNTKSAGHLVCAPENLPNKTTGRFLFEGPT